jgi:chromosome segregation ATPase
MTREEMARTMAFILEQQAQASASIAQIQSNMAEITSKQAESNSTMARLTERTDRNAAGITALLAIAEMHEREITENRAAQARTDERLNALINTVERYISERRNGKS